MSDTQGRPLIHMSRVSLRPRREHARGGKHQPTVWLALHGFQEKPGSVFGSVPVDLQPKAFLLGDKQGCQPCEPAHGTEYTKACPHTVLARRLTGSGGSLPSTEGSSSGWWAVMGEKERGFCQSEVSS